ncbi:MAG: LamG domain-containing protein [Candidatus Micrarchaeota archaeon]|nr:LamG domain-containing protein [Candidatus Micrarchaeota archaeon]
MHKAQSAMEYLITYGWAILVVSVVLASLFTLGIFSTQDFAPKASSGSCQVVRTSGISNLAGACTNMVPKLVGYFKRSSVSVGANVQSTLSNLNTTAGGYNTVTFWMQWVSPSATSAMLLDFTGYDIYYSNYFGFNAYNGDDYGICSPTFVSGRWYFISALFYNGVYTGKSAIYINGVNQTMAQCAGAARSATASPTFAIGSEANSVNNYFFYGDIANMQIYNRSLSQGAIQALYKEGIGGAPIDLQDLVAWYQLNGDANDYSGNGYQGIPTNVIWNANWQSGYSQPS